MRILSVLFDIDGTLVDSNDQHVAAWVTAFADAGHPRDAAAIREQVGKGGDLLVPALIPDADDALVTRLSDAHGQLFKDHHLDGVRPFPDAAALIRRVADGGRRVALASSASRAELEHYIDLLGIGDQVAAATSIDDVETSKPAPDIFGVALARVATAPDRAIVVGDAIYDMQAARTAGAGAIGLTSGFFDAGRLREAGAGATYADVADLLARWDTSPLA
ncbi:HAD family hydrolase [Sphingomonas bacterium]|uniref:HAD family hydrolase n=1 Tax=Sphingomonas bacterium TaxID=1895847 RepID=UPI0015766592|nr:HAD family hydrolase [Sphingomonas bacterium]